MTAFTWNSARVVGTTTMMVPILKCGEPCRIVFSCPLLEFSLQLQKRITYRGDQRRIAIESCVDPTTVERGACLPRMPLLLQNIDDGTLARWILPKRQGIESMDLDSCPNWKALPNIRLINESCLGKSEVFTSFPARKMNPYSTPTLHRIMRPQQLNYSI